MSDPYGGMPPVPPEPYHPDPQPPPPPDPGQFPPPMPPDPAQHPDPLAPGMQPPIPDIHPGYDPYAGGQPGYAAPDPYFPPDPYLPPDPPGFDPGYLPPDPPAVEGAIPDFGGPYTPPDPPAPSNYVPPDPPGFDPGYLPPDPPPVDRTIPEFGDPYVPPDPPGFSDYVPPDPPGFSDYVPPDPPGVSDYVPPDPPTPLEGDVRDTAYTTGSGSGEQGSGQAHLLFNVGLPSDHFAEHHASEPIFEVSDLHAQYDRPTVRDMEIHQGGTTYWVQASSSIGPNGVETVHIDVAGTQAVIQLPADAAPYVTLSIEPSRDPNKIVEVIVTAPFPVAMDIHNSADVTIIPSGVPFGPPTPAPEPPPSGQHHHHHAGSAEPPEPPAAQPQPASPQPPAAPQPEPSPMPPAAQPDPGTAGVSHPQPAAPPEQDSPQPASPHPDPGQPTVDPNVLPTFPRTPDPNAPTLNELLRPDPPRTGFENRLASGQAFPVPVRVHSDVDVSTITWLNRPPADPHHTRFEVIGNPAALVTPDERTFDLTVDPQAVMPIRDPHTKDLLGYRLRRGDTMFTFDRIGRLIGVGNLEAPLEPPKVDPIDVMMFVLDFGVDVGSAAAKGLAAEAEAAAAAAAQHSSKTAVGFARGPTIARFGADEVAELSRMWEQRLATEANPAVRKQAEQALRALAERGRIRDWRQSEREVVHLYEQIGGKDESAELYQDAAGKWGITKPDFTAPHVRGEVKNWETVHISSDRAANNLLDKLAAQIQARNHLPGPANIPGRMQQTVVLDLRGQALTEENLHTIGHVVAERTGLPVENIQLIVWAK